MVLETPNAKPYMDCFLFPFPLPPFLQSLRRLLKMSVLRVLNVAEKPLSALRISRCLSENDFQTSRGSPAVHTFNYEEEGWRMTVISSNGHLQGINLGEDETRWEEGELLDLLDRSKAVVHKHYLSAKKHIRGLVHE